MGGTKILPALKFVLENPVDPKYPRQVFLLTDGGIIIFFIFFIFFFLILIFFNFFIFFFLLSFFCRC